MENMSLSEQLTYSTVLIKCKYADGRGSGTGFIMHLCTNKEKENCIPVLITNKHVVANNTECIFEFCRADKNGKPIDTETLSIKYPNTQWILHPDSEIDLCCLPIGNILNDLKTKNIDIFYIPLETSILPTEKNITTMSALEDVIMIGYPRGLSDEYNHKPIIRRGSTATHYRNHYQGKKEFLVDMACFPGSSGSPIFILNEGSYSVGRSICIGSRIFFIGILYGGPEFLASGEIEFYNLPKFSRPVVNIPMNLGVAIKASEILGFEEVLTNTLNKGATP